MSELDGDIVSQQKNSPRSLGKYVIVGDGAVGKTCLLIRRDCGIYPMEYIPTVHEQFTVKESVDGVATEMYAFDIAGGEDFHRLRPLAYPGTDVFPLCFDISYPTSFENVKETWIPELNHHCPDVPILLIGCKSDLRSNEQVISKLKEKGRNFITEVQGHAMANEIGAVKYMECSALTGEGVVEVFQELGRLALQHLTMTKKRKKKCVVI